MAMQTVVLFQQHAMLCTRGKHQQMRAPASQLLGALRAVLSHEEAFQFDTSCHSW